MLIKHILILILKNRWEKEGESMHPQHNEPWYRMFQITQNINIITLPMWETYL